MKQSVDAPAWGTARLRVCCCTLESFRCACSLRKASQPLLFILDVHKMTAINEPNLLRQSAAQALGLRRSSARDAVRSAAVLLGVDVNVVVINQQLHPCVVAVCRMQ